MQADYKNKGLNLLKKGQKGIVHAIFSRFGLVLMLLILQVLILLSIFQWFEPKIPNQLYICQPIASPKSSTISFWNAVIVV